MDFIIANIMIVLAAVTLIVAVGVMGYSVVHSLKTNKRSETENGVPTLRIEIGTVALLVVVGLPSLVFGSLTDMCIILSGVLLIVAGVLIIAGRIKSSRRAKVYELKKP